MKMVGISLVLAAWTSICSTDVDARRRNASIITDGLILHLDAEAQVRAEGAGSANATWRNLAPAGAAALGHAALRNFQSDAQAGWMGSGRPGEPFALRFDGKRAFVEGPGTLEIPEITIETWARVSGVSGPHGMRGATLIGNDYGAGGVGLLISASGSPLFLHERTHTLMPAETPMGSWTQVVVSLKGGVVRLFVNGRLACAAPAPRRLQPDQVNSYQLGTARFTTMDYVACDGLIGEIAIVRVYDRALADGEVRRNFDADRVRIGIADLAPELCPVRVTSVRPVCRKWDYSDSPVGVTATDVPGALGRMAFDGYPTTLAQPYASTLWRSEPVIAGKPASLVIDYKRPVAVTRFLHYHDRARRPSAWRSCEVLASDDLLNWTSLQTYVALTPECPQVLSIDRPKEARFYKIVVRELAQGASAVAAHEIETHYGTTIGTVSPTPAAPSPGKPCTLTVRIVSPHADSTGLTLRVVAPATMLRPGRLDLAVPNVASGGSAEVRFAVTPELHGPIPLLLELRDGGRVVDRRPHTLAVTRKQSVAAGPPATRAAPQVRAEVTQKLPPGTTATWRCAGEVLRYSITAPGATRPVTGAVRLFAAGRPVVLAGDARGTLSARVPGGVLNVRVTERRPGSGDPALTCRVIPDDPNPIDPPWLDLEMRVQVDRPKVMFRPHIDWYRAEDGPHWKMPQNGHNSATRMLCIESGGTNATLSMAPDTDNMTWGFTPGHQMSALFRIRLAPPDPLGRRIWRPIDEAPMRFTVALPVRAGGWWEAYRYVVQRVFGFSEPQAWPMPVTQLQMLTTRALMSYGAWSERWQMVRAYSNDSVFWTFYGADYSLPALYQWYLATDDPTARTKADKIVDWLLNVQHADGPMAGAWFTAYADEGKPELVGGDFIRNRWLIPQATGATAITLLRHWNASGRKDARVLAAARRGCDWLLRNLRADGGWPYAFDLEGKPVTDVCGAGQIWCTWALWRMSSISGDAVYREAAERSARYFEKTFMAEHRYVGYWEDTVGITKESNKTIQSWECYEAAIAAQVFAEMGDRKRAIDAAKDLATHSWTRVTSTRTPETSLGQTTEQSLCGPSQAQSPMVGIAFKRVYELTGDRFWNDLAGATKAVGFCADPDRGYAMVATSGWADPLNAVAGPPYENVRPFVTPDMSKGDYGRQVWYQWCTDQFAWLALEWLVREGNLRAPNHVRIDPETLRGAVLGLPGRIKMPEEKVDVTGIEHYDINWVGYRNEDRYALLVMNHRGKVTVMVRPHEAHLEVYSRPPTLLIGGGKRFRPAAVVRKGVQYQVTIPAGANALLVWERIK